ncbi:MAG: hypothetical protein ACRDMV_21570 [Streptosporangiales bacterium]
MVDPSTPLRKLGRSVLTRRQVLANGSRLAAATAVGAAASRATPLAAAAPEAEGHAEFGVERFHRTTRVVASGEFAKIYDPSVGESQPWYINDHCVIRAEDGTWHLFGITHAEPADAPHEVTFAHATAPDLHGPWTKRRPALRVDKDYGETHLWAPHVIRSDGTYYMFYAGGGDDHTRTQINLATSTDLFHWTRHAGGTLFRDGFEARDPMVLRIRDKWVMYYCATDDPAGGHHVVAYRTSKDLAHWSERHIAYTSPDTGTGGGNTESPFIVQHDGMYYLFIGPCGSYAGGQNTYICTDIYASNDPFHFAHDNRVGRIASHAAEVVQDESGDWYVTHAGWGQGGVHLATLDWNEPRHESGVRVRTHTYEAELLTSPVTELTMLRRTGDEKGRNLLGTAFRGTTPYVGVGGFGDTARPGEARAVHVNRGRGTVSLRGVPLGHQPITVDWDLRFAEKWFDMTVHWHVQAQPDAPVYEAAWNLDTTLRQVGDDAKLDRGTGNVFGFPRWTLATDDSVSLVAAYKKDSAWQEYSRWFNPYVGEVAWQSIQSGVGYAWSPGTYAGGTWRMGVSTKPHDTAYADRLHAALNASSGQGS